MSILLAATLRLQRANCFNYTTASIFQSWRPSCCPPHRRVSPWEADDVVVALAQALLAEDVARPRRPWKGDPLWSGRIAGGRPVSRASRTSFYSRSRGKGVSPAQRPASVRRPRRETLTGLTPGPVDREPLFAVDRLLSRLLTLLALLCSEEDGGRCRQSSGRWDKLERARSGFCFATRDSRKSQKKGGLRLAAFEGERLIIKCVSQAVTLRTVGERSEALRGRAVQSSVVGEATPPSEEVPQHWDVPPWN